MKSELFGLKGKVAIVTGGNGGIGLGMARGLADAGADIAVVGRNEEKSKAAAADLTARGVKAIAVATDVTDKQAVARMADQVKGELGRIDILVNNAGINIRKSPHALDLDEWDSVIRTNLTSAFLCPKTLDFGDASVAIGQFHRDELGRGRKLEIGLRLVRNYAGIPGIAGWQFQNLVGHRGADA